MARAVEDALTGVVWIDDAQIAEEVISKKYHEIPGVRVIVETLEQTNGNDNLDRMDQ